MSKNSTPWARLVALLVVFGLVSACSALPRSGPNKREIFSGSVQKSGDAFVVSVNDRVTRATAVQPALGFTQDFLSAGILGSDTINPGDVLNLTIWENIDDGLLSAAGSNRTQLTELQVDGSGFIFVPYAGRIRAAGNSPEAIRRIITNKLKEQTPDPQVEVSRAAGDGSTVSLVGAIGSQGNLPIERSSRTLSGMIAAAGGITIDPELAQIVVIRGSKRSKIWFQDLYEYPQFDIALRNGDRILIEEDTRAFTALGATGSQSRVPFAAPTISALEAIASVGGLQSNAADPTGVFVMRNEPEAIANAVLGRDDLIGAQRMVYVLNLTEPNGLFMARDLLIRDGDTLYVTEAPFTQWSKVISAVTGSLTTASTVSNASTLFE